MQTILNNLPLILTLLTAIIVAVVLGGCLETAAVKLGAALATAMLGGGRVLVWETKADISAAKDVIERRRLHKQGRYDPPGTAFKLIRVERLGGQEDGDLILTYAML